MPRTSSDVAHRKLSKLFWTSWELLLAGPTEGGDCVEQSEEVQDCLVYDWDTSSIHFPLELVRKHNGEA